MNVTEIFSFAISIWLTFARPKNIPRAYSEYRRRVRRWLGPVFTSRLGVTSTIQLAA